MYIWGNDGGDAGKQSRRRRWWSCNPQRTSATFSRCARWRGARGRALTSSTTKAWRPCCGASSTEAGPARATGRGGRGSRRKRHPESTCRGEEYWWWVPAGGMRPLPPASGFFITLSLMVSDEDSLFSPARISQHLPWQSLPPIASPRVTNTAPSSPGRVVSSAPEVISRQDAGGAASVADEQWSAQTTSASATTVHNEANLREPLPHRYRRCRDKTGRRSWSGCTGTKWTPLTSSIRWCGTDSTTAP